MNKKSLHQQLEEYCSSGYLPMHMPGGKRRMGTLAPRDITEIKGFDDLHRPGGIIKKLEDDLADIWHAPEAFLSVNGATAMIESAVCAVMRYFPEGKVLAASNCHLSVWHGIEMCGCMHKTVDPVFCEAPFAMEVLPASVEKALEEDPSIKAVVITSPTYEGIISDTASVYEITRKHGCALIIDESHGAHLGLDDFWGNEACGDLVIKSLHKTLSSPTQTAVMLRYSDLIPAEDIRHYIDIFESSSPSYLLMSGVSETADLLRAKGALCMWEKAVSEAEQKLASLQNIRLFTADNKDRSKIILLCKGKNLAQILRDEYKIETEAAFDTHLIAMTGIGDTVETMTRFTGAVLQADNDYPELSPYGTYNGSGSYSHKPQMTLADASRCRWICTDVCDAEGRICAEFIYDYPPGIPVLMPGDLITSEAVCLLNDRSVTKIMTVSS